MILSAKELSERLKLNIERLCMTLLPHGKRVGREWCVGSLAGEDGRSLKICLDGASAGLWADFAGDDKGDSLDLLAKVRGISVSDAMKEARKFLGMPEAVREEVKTYAKPKRSAPPTKVSCSGISYLINERKIPQHILEAYMVGGDAQAMYFSSFDASGSTLLQIKRIEVERKDGKKVVRTEAGCAPCLFGWQAIGKRERSVVICEGEIDAMSWASYGFPALSVPFGAGNLDWMEFEFENLSRFDEILLSFDDDEAGQKQVGNIMRRLGMHRVRSVRLPRKDMNEWLVAYGPAIEEIELVIADAYTMHPVQFVDVESYVDEAFRSIIGEKSGIKTAIFGDGLRFRDGETTLWTGTSGHGKSTLLSQLCLEYAAKGERVAVASMEMPIHQQIKKLAYQYHCSSTPTLKMVEETAAFLRGRYYPLDVYGMVSVNKLLELMEYAVRRYNCRHIVIDSLMKLDVSGDDYDAQRVAMNLITTFAAEHKIHAHVVAHPRKGESDRKAVGLLDVKGSGDLINQPDNVVVVWRNKVKEQAISAGRDGNGPDCRAIIEKQRSTGELPEVDLFFDRSSQQFIRYGNQPIKWASWVFSENNSTK